MSQNNGINDVIIRSDLMWALAVIHGMGFCALALDSRNALAVDKRILGGSKIGRSLGAKWVILWLCWLFSKDPYFMVYEIIPI